MMLSTRGRQLGLAVATILGLALFEPTAHGQDAAWEGLINAGRNALQQKNFSEAERLFESALEAAEGFSSDDPRLGKSYNNLAAVYYAQEDYARAEPLMRRALTQLRETLGPENTEVAQTMKNLAALYYLQGNRGEAEALLKGALAILEKIHGPNHAFVAAALNDLAGFYQAEDRYEDAEPLLTRSLGIWESLLGSEHPDVVRSRDLLARVREANTRIGERDDAVAAEDAAQDAVDRARDQGAPTPLVADGQAQPAASDAGPSGQADDEIEEATEALERLAEVSKAEANLADAAELASRGVLADGADDPDRGGVPAPALSPIGNAGDAAAAAVTAPDDERVYRPDLKAADGEPPLPAAGAANSELATSNPAAPTNAATSALGPIEPGAGPAVALLDQAPSADDVSFAVYLSTLWSVDEAKRYWQALREAMPGFLEGKQMEIEEVAAAGGKAPFYRVLTMPYSSDPEAREACEELKSKLRTHDCSVVVRGETAGG